MIITSLDNKKIKDLKKLYTRKYRDEENLFLVEGDHLVREAYKQGLLVELIVTEGTIIELDVNTTYVTPGVMNDLTSLTTPTTVVGVCKKQNPSKDLGKRILMLDNVQDPGNIGTIIRSAVAFNIDTIIMGEGCVDLYNNKVLRATQGLIFHINIREANLQNIISTLKDENYKIIGTSVTSGTDLRGFTMPSKFALIMGNEGHGMNEELNDLCDDFLYINMNKDCESLNVGVACSIILYQLDK